MYLVDPATIATAVSVRPNGGAGNLDDDMLKSLVKNARAPIETTMNVETLARTTAIDTFRLVADSTKPVSFRLSNGFLTDTVLVITDSSGVVVVDPLMLIDKKLGVVTLEAATFAGRYTIQYESGFDVADPSDIAQNVPDELEGIITAEVTLWLRTMLLAPRLPSVRGITVDQLTTPLYKEIGRRIYGWYQRPRVMVEIPIHYQTVA